MKAFELIGREFSPSEGVHFDVDEENGYVVKVDTAEWTFDEDGPRVMLSYHAGDLANFDGELMTQRYEWVLPSEHEVHIIDDPWQGDPECQVDVCVLDCETECELAERELTEAEHEAINAHYRQPASRLDYTLEDYAGDELTIGATVVPSGELAASVDSDDTIIAIPRSQVPEVISALLAKVGVTVPDIHVAEDHDYGEHEWIGTVEVLGGSIHPAAHPYLLPTECILADIAFLAEVYQHKKLAEESADAAVSE